VSVGQATIVPMGSPRLSRNGHMLQFRDMRGSLNIYGITGKRVRAVALTGDGSVDIGSLPSGAYLAKAGHETLKFIRE
jgi:hypothetical protein